jgi:spore maturation protein CgeB
VEPWLRRINAELLLAAKRLEPDLLVIVGMVEELRIGTLAQLRALLPVKVVWIWPDQMANWTTDMTTMLPVVDLVATFSSTTVKAFAEMGARDVLWVPLAADPELHGFTAAVGTGDIAPFDVSFIGAWRPSREEILTNLDDCDLRIWGNNWGRAARRDPVIRRAWQRTFLSGSDLTRAVRASRINLNIIEPSTYPASNMRVFELLIAGGFQLSSACPEVADVLRHGEHLYYFDRAPDVPDIVSDLLGRPEERQRVAEAGQREVAARHTYNVRARAIAERCGFTA